MGVLTRAFDSPISPSFAYCALLAIHLISVVASPIQDCDEVFNFWEPTHYLNHGYGLQTWEFSPQYAIRSWLYAGGHASVVYLTSWLALMTDKHMEFYVLRSTLAAVCAICETWLFSSLSRSMGRPIANVFLLVMMTSSGMFHASIAYLPSSFALYMNMLGMSAFLDWRGGAAKTARGIMWYGIGTIVGWPFAAVLCLPFLLEEVAVALLFDEIMACMLRFLDGLLRCMIVLGLEIAVDSFFYQKFTCVPFNIVSYNVFSGSGRGPNIYGTEPWHFYLRNLVLNFNLWFVLALLALPLWLLQKFHGKQSSSRMTSYRQLVFISPMYLWLAIFTVQPHKEERFMYPIYSSIALNAAISSNILLSSLPWSSSKSEPNSGTKQVRSSLVACALLVAALLGVWRSVGLSSAFAAPLELYSTLHQLPSIDLAGGTIHVCVGKEWYRFPSSYHLPSNARLKFIKSEFSGLLPGSFSEATVGFGLYPGASLVPTGMNDENREDLGKYTSIEHCQYLIDSSLPSFRETLVEQNYSRDHEHWERVKCIPFLDAASTGILGRLFWIPDAGWVPSRFRRVYGEYCLLKQKP